MFRIADAIAQKNKLKALVTGESVGQVASQTIVNLSTINNAVDMLILRPLAGYDKEEVITISKRIDTFEISKEQVPDSCTVFAPNAPATAAPQRKIEIEEEKLDIDELLQEAVDDTLKSSKIEL
jgi:thiamine biosynthesis protein ThiI